MDTRREKEFYKEVREMLRKRTKPQSLSPKNRVGFGALFLLLLFLAYGSGLFMFFTARTNGWKISLEVIYHALWFISYLLGAWAVNIKRRVLPQNQHDIDRWKWYQGRKVLGLIFIAVTIQAINLALPSGENAFNQYRYLISSGMLAYALFLASVLTVLFKPELFLSDVLTGFGSGCFAFAIGFMPVRLIAMLKPSLMTSWALTILPAIVVSVILIRQQFNRKRLNYVQFASISVVHPDKLLAALRTHYQIIKDQYEALKIKLRLEEKLSFGIKAELIKLFAQEHKSSHEMAWWVLGSLLLFIVGALGEAFFQDLLYKPILSPLLCKLFETFCN